MCDCKTQGQECAIKHNAIAGMKQLHETAKDCKTKADFVAFMKSNLPIKIEEVEDGIILHLNKTSCTCSNPEFIAKYGTQLCECTKAHEEYTWSIFFGKQIDVEIVGSILRGGNDCVIKLCL